MQDVKDLLKLFPNTTANPSASQTSGKPSKKQKIENEKTQSSDAQVFHVTRHNYGISNLTDLSSVFSVPSVAVPEVNCICSTDKLMVGRPINTKDRSSCHEEKPFVVTHRQIMDRKVFESEY